MVMFADEETTSLLALAPRFLASEVNQLASAFVVISIDPARESMCQPHMYMLVWVALGAVAEMLIPPPVVAIEAISNAVFASL